MLITKKLQFMDNQLTNLGLCLRLSYRGVYVRHQTADRWCVPNVIKKVYMPARRKRRCRVQRGLIKRLRTRGLRVIHDRGYKRNLARATNVIEKE